MNLVHKAFLVFYIKYIIYYYYYYTLASTIMQVTKFKVNGNIIVSQRFNDKYEEMILFYLLCTMDITYIKIFHEI